MRPVFWLAVVVLFAILVTVVGQDRRIVDLPEPTPSLECKCGPDCACCEWFEEDEIKKKRRK